MNVTVAGNGSLNGSAAGRKLLLRRPQPSPSPGRRVTSEAGGDADSGEEGAGETMPQVYDTHYFSLAHLFGFRGGRSGYDVAGSFDDDEANGCVNVSSNSFTHHAHNGDHDDIVAADSADNSFEESKSRQDISFSH